MKINYLEIQGFKSFVRKCRFDFTDLSKGLYFISGDNQVDVELGSNGGGKSTFFSDAFMWIFTGKTSLGLKASNVKSWDSKEKCLGTIGFSIDNIDFEVFRSWSPNSLQVKEVENEFKEISQEELDDLIGFNHTSLLHSVVISQFAPKFFDLDPAIKLQVFSKILGDVDIWLDYSDKAKNEVGQIQNDSELENDDLNKLIGSLETLQNQDYSEMSKEWGKENAENIKELEKELEYFIEERKVSKKELRKVEEYLDDCIEDEKKVEIGLKCSEKQVEEYNLICRDIEKSLDKREVLLNREYDDLKKFEDVGGVCPYCDQEVSKKHLLDKEKEIRDRLEVLVEEDAIEVEKLREYKESADVLFLRNKEYEKSHDSACKKIIEYEDLENTVISEIKSKTVEVTNKANAIDLAKKTKNPYLDLQEKNEEFIRNTKINIAKKEKSLILSREQEDIYSYWVKAFKEIRLLVINEALNEFEIYLNNSLQDFGLYDWKIKVDVDKETKSKTIKKGFYVTVESPKQKTPVPFECYCGGERGALRVSATLGLIEFIKSRKGVSCDLEIWDEPTVNLSPEATENLLTILQQRGKEKKVLLIDHHKLGSSGVFTGHINVIKDDKGSRIELN